MTNGIPVEVEQAISRLEAAGFRFNLPAPDPEAQIGELAAALGCGALPPEVTALYWHGDGMSTRLQPDYDARFPEGEGPGEGDIGYGGYGGDGEEDGSIGDLFRLMTAAEVREMHPHLESFGFTSFGRRCFWTDDQSNYAAVYVEGPLAGRVCLLSHDGPDPSPVYRSVLSFLAAVGDSGLRGFIYDGPDHKPGADYPALTPRAGNMDTAHSADRDALRELWPLFRAATETTEREQYAFAIVALTPFEQTDSILPFTDDQDFFIVQKACTLLGLRRWEPATGRLGEVALHGVSNGRVAATLALGEIGAPAALDALVRAHEGGPVREVNGSSWLFERAFAGCGCQIDRSNTFAPRYRLPGSEEWKPLRRG